MAGLTIDQLEDELHRAERREFKMGDGGDDDSIDLQLKRARLHQQICTLREKLLSRQGNPKLAATYRKLAMDASTEQSRIKRNAMWDRVNELERKLNDRDQIPADLRTV